MGSGQLGSIVENRESQVLLLPLVWGLLTLETRAAYWRHLHLKAQRRRSPKPIKSESLGLGPGTGFPLPFHGKD